MDRDKYLNRRDYEDYYRGFANDTLWPTLHYRPSLARFDWSVLSAEPDLLVIALGSNDYLMGVPADVARAKVGGSALPWLVVANICVSSAVSK